MIVPFITPHSGGQRITVMSRAVAIAVVIPAAKIDGHIDLIARLVILGPHSHIDSQGMQPIAALPIRHVTNSVALKVIPFEELPPISQHGFPGLATRHNRLVRDP